MEKFLKKEKGVVNPLLMKDLPIPQRLILTEILKKHLKRGHPKHSEIEKDLAKRWAGYWGERALANYVKELPQEKYLIFHDLGLQLNGIYFQIDTLLISQNYIHIIEAKNISGTLYFDNVFNQLININPNGTEESFEDPRVQCQRLHSLLKRWLVKNGHIEALLVHFLLINPTITNKECQNLLHLPSRDSTQKFLLSLNLPTTGHTKNRQYHQWSYPESYFILEENQIKPIFCQEKVPACVLS